MNFRPRRFSSIGNLLDEWNNDDKSGRSKCPASTQGCPAKIFHDLVTSFLNLTNRRVLSVLGIIRHPQ
jgi:hypothetical protein